MARRAAAGRRVGCVVRGAACRRGACRCGASALGAVWRAASALRAFWKNAVTGRAPGWLTVCREGAAGCEVRARTPMSKPTTRHHDARRRARCSGAQTVVTGRSDVLPVPPCRSGLGTTHPPYPVPPPCPASAASAAGRDPSATPHASPLHQQTAGHTQTRPSGGTGMRNAPSGAHRGGPRQTGRDGAGLDEYAAGNPPDVFGAGAGKESQQPSLGATPQSSGTGGGHGEGASRRPLPLARAFGTQHGERSPASTPPPPSRLRARCRAHRRRHRDRLLSCRARGGNGKGSSSCVCPFFSRPSGRGGGHRRPVVSVFCFARAVPYIDLSGIHVSVLAARV